MSKEQNSHQEAENQQTVNSEEQTCESTPAQDTDTVADESFEASDISAEEAVAVWRDKYARLSAEFDNYRKRTLREKMELISTGGEDVIKPMLGVMDDFDRALAAMQTAKDVEAVREGVELIRQKFFDALRSKGVSEIEAKGLELDTDLHDAVAQFPVEDASMKGKVIDVVQKGYKLKDKVVRHCKVVVGE